MQQEARATMTSEERQQILEFVVKQQEQFAANMEQAEARMSRMEGTLVNAVNIIGEMVKMQRELLETQKDMVATQRLVAEGGRATDARVNALIDTVERLLGDGRDGGYIN